MYNHHGIYITDDEIIHFASEENDNILGTNNQVLGTEIGPFLKGGLLEVKIYTDDEFPDLFPVEDIVRYARACIGDTGYNLFFNNCEHFANYCTLGRFRSHQVEQILTLPIKGENPLGLFGWIGKLFSGGSSTRSTSSSRTNTNYNYNYNYDPDKVRAAEIEQENIKLLKDAQKELIQMNTQMELALMEAKVRGFSMVQSSLIEMIREANLLAEQRIALLGQAQFDVIKKANDYYNQLSCQIEKDGDQFMCDRLPKIMDTWKSFPEGSSQYKMYEKTVENYIEKN
jgi:hypothetical protein